MSLKHLFKQFIGKNIRSCLAAVDNPGGKVPKPILMDRTILTRTFSHFEQRKQTWEFRGSTTKLDIGHYFEFGCYDGDTLLDFFNALVLKYGDQLPEYWRIFAFDSFEGLPDTELQEDLHLFAGKGSYKSKGPSFVKQRMLDAGCDSNRITLIPGFYEESLTEKLRNKLLNEGVFASFVNIDCDYYSSTMTVLNWIEPLLVDGSIVYFDDIYFYNCNPNKGELRAISDFNESRSKSGLAPAPFFDRAHRCYMYWRDEDLKPKNFEFQKYVTG